MENSGRAVSIPVWFVLDGEKLYLLPAYGWVHSGTRTCSRTSSVRIKAPGAEAAFKVVPSLTPHKVSSVTEKFRAKYGDGG